MNISGSNFDPTLRTQPKGEEIKATDARVASVAQTNLPNAQNAFDGWSPDQKKLFDNLKERMPLVARGFSNGIDLKNATPQQQNDAQRFVRSDPALVTIEGNLKKIGASATLSPEEKAKAYSAEFDKVSDLNQFVSDVQKRDNITDRGVKLLPMLTEEQSKEFGERFDRMRDAMSGANRALDPKLHVQFGEPEKNRVVELTKANAALLEVPNSLKRVEANPNLSPAQKQEQVDKMLAQMPEVDKKISSVERDLVNQAAALEYTAAPQPGAFSRAWSKVKEFGSRVSDAFSNLGDRIKNTFSKSEPNVEFSQPTIKSGPDTTQPEKKVQGQEHDTTARDTTLANQTHQTNLQKANTQQLDDQKQVANHLKVEAGEAGKEFTKGLGFTASGHVDEIKHVDGKTEIDYTVRGHHQAIKVDDHSAIAKAANEMKPGDDFKLAISKDAKGNEIASLDDKTTGHSVKERNDGRVEEKTELPQPGVERKTFSR